MSVEPELITVTMRLTVQDAENAKVIMELISADNMANAVQIALKLTRVIAEKMGSDLLKWKERND